MVRRSSVRCFFFSVVALLPLLSTAPLLKSTEAFAAGADYDGNGFSEIPVLTTQGSGAYEWHLFDPFSAKSTVFTKGFGSPSDTPILANWLYPNVTSAGVVSAPNSNSQGRLVWRIRTAVQGRGRRSAARGRRSVIREQMKLLGRPGDILVTGGDFNGDKVADAVVITDRGTGRHKWGLRGNFFLASYNSALNVNRAYFDFGTIGVDRPFFLNPDGESDWFAVVRDIGKGRQRISYIQPFSQEVRSLVVNTISVRGGVPIPLAQDDGTDCLVFYSERNGGTDLSVVDLSGRLLAAISIPLSGDVTVGNYGPGPGEEIAVSQNGKFHVFNPVTGRTVTLTGPTGYAVDSINIENGS